MGDAAVCSFLTRALHGRGGGATWYFEQRGRWRSERTLEIYVQEVAARSILAGADHHVRARVDRYAQAAAFLLADPARTAG